jgi:Fe-S-cluster-containing dehydrogenase component/anaerobic selenocysteine-containing dehydrogenase
VSGPMYDGLDEISRRRFLTLLSASAALAFSSSCSKIDRGTIVAYTKRPGDILPGVASYYASTFQEGLVTHGVLVKTREGRPIHIEGNSEHAVSPKTSLRAMGDLLGLYDPDRLRAPSFKGEPRSWEEAQKALARSLSDARLMDRPILLLTGAAISPTQKSLIDDLRLAFPSLRHSAWEPNAPQGELEAAGSLYGSPVSPRPRFDRADVVLSLQSDFLGADAPLFIREFAARRAISNPNQPMNRLWVVEGGMTLTGANADERLQIRPSAMTRLLFAVIRFLNESLSMPLPAGLKPQDLKSFDYRTIAGDSGIDPSTFTLLANDLARAGRSALVVAGPALPPEAHIACALLNATLGSLGNTVDFDSAPPPSEILTFAGLQELLNEVARGNHAVGIFWGTNPAYAFPQPALWKKAIAKVRDTFRIGLYEDETALDCSWRIPENHWLESWGDFEPSSDFVSLRQPAIASIYDTLQAEEFLLSCMRRMRIRAARSYLDYLRDRWRSDVYSVMSPAPFEIFWNAALSNGGAQREPRQRAPLSINEDAARRALTSASGPPSAAPDQFEVILSPAAGIYDGRYANNGWLQELPDPVTKTTWSNPALVSANDAEQLGLSDGDVVRITTAAGSADAPVLIQPGQARGVVTLALGYGRRTGNVAAGIGSNAYPLIDASSNSPYLARAARIERGKGRHVIPKTQQHDRMEGRDLARSWTLAEYSGKHVKGAGPETPEISLIPSPVFPGQKWGMVIDLSACVGCSVCVIACQSENNIPVVGPERIAEGRGMHWIRIDRYYEGDPGRPSTLHQPVLCQHCDNAPCEIVCPVNATTHSPDGLNQMAYNRCVGTRYCSNNCPFKVRRFNFFDYTSMKKEPELLVYNPEVTVRPRGVMEKCTFCIQRIENAKQKAKVEHRGIPEEEVQPACAKACPAGAIVFGNLNDRQSRVSRASDIDRNYRMLEELGIKPSVVYLADISNPAIKRGRA